MTDYTKQVVKKSFSSTVSVKGSPISLAECKAFKKKHPKYVRSHFLALLRALSQV